MEEEKKKKDDIKKEPSVAEDTSTQSGSKELPVRKDTWPELVGRTSEDAEKTIKAKNSGFKIQVVPADSFVTMDFCTDRVRIFVDEFGKVARPPRIG
ncbi:hypothetical protein LIER_37510 [Lithospermum erythrorhizon]|uniref:Uncharacterized protein n=1 Tax=Lithospermum erythrorhizon TaxID=34254 RepID=A0AAV3PQG0_LITER